MKGKPYILTNYEFLNISKYILFTLKYYSGSKLNDTVNTLLFIHYYILNSISGRISVEFINNIPGLIYILDAKSLLLHFIF